MPEQVAGQRSHGRIALPLGDTLAHQVAPMGERMTGMFAVAKARTAEPGGHRRKRHLAGRVPRPPAVGPAAGVNRWRRDDNAAVAAQIQPRSDAGAVPHRRARMQEIDVPPAATGFGFHRFGQGAVTAFQIGKRLRAAVAGIDVEDNEPRGGARHDGDVGIRPLREPAAQLRLVRCAVLVGLPGDDRALCACRRRHDRPAQRAVAQGSLKNGVCGFPFHCGSAFAIARFFRRRIIRLFQSRKSHRVPPCSAPGASGSGVPGPVAVFVLHAGRQADAVEDGEKTVSDPVPRH